MLNERGRERRGSRKRKGEIAKLSCEMLTLLLSLSLSRTQFGLWAGGVDSKKGMCCV